MKIPFLFLALVAVLAAAPAPVRSQPAADNDGYVDPGLDLDRMIDRFENEGREVFALREAIVAAAAIRPGETVADVGAGTGAFLDPLVAAVGDDGQVVAVEISIRFVEHLRRTADEAGYGNVTVVHSSPASATLPPASVDRVLLVDTYHHFGDHEAMLASLRAALRPGGDLVVVDFDRHDGARAWIQGHVRAPKDVFRAEIEAAGFAFVEEVAVEGMAENFLFRFRRP